jgi:hypothetical protein
MVVGAGFGTSPSIQLVRLIDDPGRPTSLRELKDTALSVSALQPRDESVKFLIPSNFEPGVYSVRLQSGSGVRTSFLNVPRTYFSLGDQGAAASPGGWLRLFGRNLGSPRAVTKVALVDPGRADCLLFDASRATAWDLQVDLPADTATGQYEVYVHNGHGDSSAWRSGGHLVVRAPELWPTRTFDVRQFGATGRGGDDTAAVAAALAAAGAAGGGVVLFPRGRYVVSGTLSIPRYVTLRGERSDLSYLAWPDTEAPPVEHIRGTNHFAIEGLTIYASNHGRIIASDLQLTADGPPGWVRIERVRIIASAFRGYLTSAQIDARLRALRVMEGGTVADAITLGGEHLIIKDCDVVGSGRSLALEGPRSSLVARNRLGNGRMGWYSLAFADGLVFEDNEVYGADLMAAGGGGINTLGYSGAASQKVFFARNKIHGVFGWDREAMTTDGSGGLYMGAVVEVAPTRLRLSGKLAGDPNVRGGWRGAGVFVLDGAGIGQYAQVERLDGQEVLLDRPFAVIPDSSSVVSITMMQRNYLFVANEFADTGVALQYYGTSIDFVAAGNKASRAGGFNASGRFYLHMQPSWFCQFFDNEILEGNTYGKTGEATLGVEAVAPSPPDWPVDATVPDPVLSLATVIRRNHLHSNAHIAVVASRPRALADDARAILRDVVIDKNVVEHADVGIVIGRWTEGVLARDNEFVDVGTPVTSEDRR